MDGSRKPLMILLGAVAGLLLVGCVNIANLLLARAAGQKQQMAVAAALGASRSEMLRMAMRETVVLAGAGCGLGILLAMLIVPLMQHYLPPELNFRGALELDWAGAGCALLLAVAATLLAGAAPAWMVSRTAPQEVLHSESRLASESRSSRRARRVLVGVEVAVSVALVLMTGLVVASLTKLMRVDRGFDTERTLAVSVEMPWENYPNRAKRAEFYRDALAKLNALPGVEQAALTSILPLHGEGWGDMAQLPGDTRPWTQLPGESWRWISPNYFEAIHLKLLAGRFFNDSEWGRNEAVLSERTAKALWPGKNPVGQQFRRAGAEGEAPFTVVGVVADARTVTLAKPDPMLIYVPYWFRADANGGTGDPDAAGARGDGGIDPEGDLERGCRRGRAGGAAAERSGGGFGGGPALRDGSAAGVRRQRIAVGGTGRVRRGDVFRGAAAAGDRTADCAGRAAGEYLSADPARGAASGGGRRGGGDCRRAGIGAAGGEFAV